MNYYDINAFRGPENLIFDQPFEVYYSDYIEDQFCYNDSYFLLNLMKNRFIGNDLEFRDILIGFYKFFNGKKEEWLLHTMDIVYFFNDLPTDKWLQEELVLIQNNLIRKLTAKEILSEYLHNNDLEKMFQKANNQKEVFIRIAEIHGNKWSTYQQLYKTRKDWYPL